MKIAMFMTMVIVLGVFVYGMLPFLTAIMDLDTSFYSNPWFMATSILVVLTVFFIALSRGRPGEVRDVGGNFGGGGVFRPY